jgi:hypothetical protein
MLILRVSLVLLALLGTVGPGPGQRSTAAASQEAPASEAPPAAPPATPPAPDPLLEFVPREHVPADSAVSFPVDI